MLRQYIPGVQSAGWLDIHFTVGTSCERAAPLAEVRSAQPTRTYVTDVLGEVTRTSSI
jgi:hypothetical protein